MIRHRKLEICSTDQSYQFAYWILIRKAKNIQNKQRMENGTEKLGKQNLLFFPPQPLNLSPVEIRDADYLHLAKDCFFVTTLHW